MAGAPRLILLGCGMTIRDAMTLVLTPETVRRLVPERRVAPSPVPLRRDPLANLAPMLRSAVIRMAAKRGANLTDVRVISSTEVLIP